MYDLTKDVVMCIHMKQLFSVIPETNSLLLTQILSSGCVQELST